MSRAIPLQVFHTLMEERRDILEGKEIEALKDVVRAVEKESRAVEKELRAVEKESLATEAIDMEDVSDVDDDWSNSNNRTDAKITPK